MALFQALNRDGITIIVVTHEDDVARFAKRILRFRDGRLIDDLAVAERRLADQVLANWRDEAPV